MSLPKINIKHGQLLQDVFVNYLSKIPGEEERAKLAPVGEKAKEMVKTRKDFWGKESDLILDAIQKVTGLHFAREVIDVYLIYGYGHAFSDPLVIGFKATDTVFVDTLTHELIHHILLYSKEEIQRNIKWLIARFPDVQSPRALIHILVHAIHKAIYLEYQKSPERLARNIENVKDWGPYKQSWDIVDKVGYKEIIAMFKTENNLK